MTLEGGNFDGLAAGEVVVSLGATKVPSVSVTPSRISFTAPTATHARLNLRVLAGWKGWSDFGPLINAGRTFDNVTGPPRMFSQVAVIFGDGRNAIASFAPADGSILGGTRVKIAGSGFHMPASRNRVLLRRSSGASVGECAIRTGTLTQIECVTPELDRATWGFTTVQEQIWLEVNGVAVDTASAPLAFTYTLSKTPRVLRTEPAALSYAASGNVTIVGYNFGLLARQTSVVFDQRVCKVWSVNETAIVCQLLRRSMAQAPLCSENGNSPGCIRAAYNFSVTPTVLIYSKGYGEVRSPGRCQDLTLRYDCEGAFFARPLDTRFEIHSVAPAFGSEHGGAEVTVRGVGFGSPAMTNMLMVAVTGSFGDWTKWTPTEIVFTSRKVMLNVDLVEVNVNLIEAEHKCGPDQTNMPCKYAAFNVAFTPQVEYAPVTEGRAGDELTFRVSHPSSALVLQSQVTVRLGEHACPLSAFVAQSKMLIEVKCTVPEFPASVVSMAVRVLPWGYANFTTQEGQDFTQKLVVDEVAVGGMQNLEISLRGGVLTLGGAGFAPDAGRHFVWWGEDFGLCEPISSSYSRLECAVNWASWSGTEGGGSRRLNVELWDEEVGLDPLLAFGNTEVACLKTYSEETADCLSASECALRCLTRSGCKAFSFHPTRQSCGLSNDVITTGSNANALKIPTASDCRYYERRGSGQNFNGHLPFVTTYKNNGVQFFDSKNPGLITMFTVGGGSRPDYVGTGCDAAGNANCCSTSNLCKLGEGGCSGHDGCFGDLVCVTGACPWSNSGDGATQGSEACCALRGHATEGYGKGEQLWRAGDSMALRIARYPSGGAWDAAVAAPDDGYVTVDFDGVPCPVTAIRARDSGAYREVACQLGNVPGGLEQHAVLTIEPWGRSIEGSTWVFLPLSVTGGAAVDGSMTPDPMAASSLGGGWVLNIAGTGFASPPDAGADSYVEVSICGKRCEVVSSTHDSVRCLVPNVTTPGVAAGSYPDLAMPRAQVISRSASEADSLSTSCFHGKGAELFEYGHPGCVALFDSDYELSAGFTGANCFVGVDFGPQANVRMEVYIYIYIYIYTQRSLRAVRLLF